MRNFSNEAFANKKGFHLAEQPKKFAPLGGIGASMIGTEYQIWRSDYLIWNTIQSVPLGVILLGCIGTASHTSIRVQCLNMS